MVVAQKAVTILVDRINMTKIKMNFKDPGR